MANPDKLDFDEVNDTKTLGVDDDAIGQGRFKNVLAGLSAPTNKLPEDENPAGWFIVNNRYVNCDGKTPDELAKDDPATIQKRLVQSEIRRQHAEQADKVRLASIDLQLENQRLQKQLALSQKIQSTDESKSSNVVLPPAAGLTEE